MNVAAEKKACSALITQWPNLRTTTGEGLETTWEQFFMSLAQAPAYLGDLLHPGWSAAQIDPCERNDKNVVRLSALVLDYDEGTSLDAACQTWEGFLGLLHTTRKHTVARPRFRIILPLSRHVTPTEYVSLWKWARDLASNAGQVVDPSTRNVSRFWYLPGIKEGGLYETRDISGEPVDVEAILASAADKPRPQLAIVPRPTTETFDGVSVLEKLFRNAGKLGRPLQRGKYTVVCRWAHEHTSGTDHDSSTVLWPAKPGSKLGHVHCSHGHCAGRTTDDVLASFSESERASAGWSEPKPREPQAAPGPGQPKRRQFALGDVTEIAAAYLDEHETKAAPMTYEGQDFYQYDPSSGTWKIFDHAVVACKVADFSGCYIIENDKWKPLKMSGSMIAGATSLVANRLIARPNKPVLDAPITGIAFKNGFLTIDGLSPNSPDNRATFGHELDFDPQAKAPQLQDFLSEIFDDVSEEERAARCLLVQEFAGAAMFGIATKYQKALLLIGEGRNGKSQLLHILKACVPDCAVSALPPSQWDGNLARFRVVLLRDSLLNSVDDIKPTEFVDAVSFKQIVTGDLITGEYKNRDSFKFHPRCAHVFSTNTIPSVTDFSEGFFRRFQILALTRDMGKSVRHEVEIGRRIVAEERPGLLAWAAQGARRLVAQHRYTETPDAAERKARWAVESDSAALFLEECAFVRPGALLKAMDAYQAYSTWSKRSGLAPVSLPKFGIRVARVRGITMLRRKDGNYYNVELKPEAQTSWR